MITIRTKAWLEKEGKLVFGEGRLQVLKEIDKTHSISKAAQNLDMSFRRAWSYIDSIEKNLGISLLERERGGKGGGGSRLTAQAKKLMAEFYELNESIREFADQRFKEMFKWKPTK